MPAKIFVKMILAAIIMMAACQSIELSNRLKRVVKRYVWNSLSGPQYKTETEYETLDMVCFNWGYEDTGMVSSSGDTIWYNMYDTTWSAGGHDYIESRNMIYGFTD